MDKQQNKRASKGTKTKAYTKSEADIPSSESTDSLTENTKAPDGSTTRVDIGLDASTSTVGLCVIDSETGDMIKLTYLDLSSKVKYEDLYDKVNATRDFISNLVKQNPNWVLNKVCIEQFAKQFTPGFSSADTLFTLAMFNHAICQYVYDNFKMKPEKINVRTARKNANVIIDYKDRSKTTKQKVFNKVKEINPNFPWFTYIAKAGKHKGTSVYGKQNEDMADAWVVAMGGWMTYNRLMEEQVKKGRHKVGDPKTGKMRTLSLEEYRARNKNSNPYTAPAIMGT